MLVRTLPKEIEDEVLDRPQLRTMEDIIDYIREKLAYKNQKSLASYIRPSSQRVNALRNQQEESDDDDDETDAQGRGRRDGKSGGEGRSSMQQSIAALTNTVTQLVTAIGQKPGQQRGNSPARKPKFIWKGGCHECGGDHMKRDCSKWKKLMEQNGGKIPEGHVNAYTKARDAHNQKHGITSSAAPAKRASSPCS